MDEFDFTTCKIYENFSNYSAWQRRAHLLPAYLNAMSEETAVRASLLRNEVELCRNAAWTEPADQSVWFYQRWFFEQLPGALCSDDEKELIKLLATEQLKSMEELIKEEPNAALAHSFVLFLVERFEGQVQSGRPRELLEHLLRIDPLRREYWQMILKDK